MTRDSPLGNGLEIASESLLRIVPVSTHAVVEVRDMDTGYMPATKTSQSCSPKRLELSEFYYHVLPRAVIFQLGHDSLLNVDWGVESMEANQVISSNSVQPNKTISRWQLLELIGLGKETGLEGVQIRQVLAAEYGVDPDYTSRLLVEFTQKGYVISQPAPKKEGVKGAGRRKVFIRTDKENDLSDKPIPHVAVLVQKLTTPVQEADETIGTPNAPGRTVAKPAKQAKPEQEVTSRPATKQGARQEAGASSARRKGRQQLKDSTETGSERQQALPYSMQDAVDDHKGEVPAEEQMATPSAQLQSVPISVQASPPISDESPIPSVPIEPALSSGAPSSNDTTPHPSTTAPQSVVHDALSKAIDQFSDLLLLQVAAKLGAFVASNLAPLESATNELCSQIEAIKSKLEAVTQQLATPVEVKASVPKADSSPAHQVESVSDSVRPMSVGLAARQPAASSSTDLGSSSGIGKGHPKADRPGGKKGSKNTAGQLGNIRPGNAGQHKLKALLIGLPSDQEHLIRERFGGQYDFLFLGSNAGYSKVRSIKGHYEIVLGLEEGCSPAIKDALKGHPHKAILPRPSQLMDELEEFFQLQLERSQT